MLCSLYLYGHPVVIAGKPSSPAGKNGTSMEITAVIKLHHEQVLIRNEERKKFSQRARTTRVMNEKEKKKSP